MKAERETRRRRGLGVERRRRKSDGDDDAGSGGRSFRFRRSSFVPGVFFPLSLSQSPSPPPSQHSFPPELLRFCLHTTTRRCRATPQGAEERAREKEKRAETRVEKWPCVRSPARPKKRQRLAIALFLLLSLPSLFSSPPGSHFPSVALSPSQRSPFLAPVKCPRDAPCRRSSATRNRGRNSRAERAGEWGE